jgi:hypothetical protein
MSIAPLFDDRILWTSSRKPEEGCPSRLPVKFRRAGPVRVAPECRLSGELVVNGKSERNPLINNNHYL